MTEESGGYRLHATFPPETWRAAREGDVEAYLAIADRARALLEEAGLSRFEAERRALDAVDDTLAREDALDALIRKAGGRPPEE